MKKSIIIFLSVLAISLAFSGCGESEGSVTGNGLSNSSLNGGSSTGADVVAVVDNGNPEETVAKLPFNLSAAVGTPPSIPEE